MKFLSKNVSQMFVITMLMIFAAAMVMGIGPAQADLDDQSLYIGESIGHVSPVFASSPRSVQEASSTYAAIATITHDAAKKFGTCKVTYIILETHKLGNGRVLVMAAVKPIGQTKTTYAHATKIQAKSTMPGTAADGAQQAKPSGALQLMADAALMR
jgi:hypothetical protein